MSHHLKLFYSCKNLYYVFLMYVKKKHLKKIWAENIFFYLYFSTILLDIPQRPIQKWFFFLLKISTTRWVRKKSCTMTQIKGLINFIPLGQYLLPQIVAEVWKFHFFKILIKTKKNSRYKKFKNFLNPRRISLLKNWNNFQRQFFFMNFQGALNLLYYAWKLQYFTFEKWLLKR